MIAIVLLALESQSSHAQASQKLNYVQPYKSVICPDDPCHTFDEYTNATDEYFVSDVGFIFIDGIYYLHNRLYLTNISNMYFCSQGRDKRKVQIFIDFLTNITFAMSNNITLSHVTFVARGSQVISYEGGPTILLFRRTFNVLLSNLTFLGDGKRFGQSAITYYLSNSWMEDIHAEGMVGFAGAAFTAINSTVALTGNNTFFNNTATSGAGVIYAHDCNVSISGWNYFEGNRALQTGGAIVIADTMFELNGVAHFIRNTAAVGGAVAILNGNPGHDKITTIDGDMYFNNNCARYSNHSEGHGAAIYIACAHVYVRGQIMIRRNFGNFGTIKVEYSTVTIAGNVVFISNAAHYLGGAIASISTHISIQGTLKFTNNSASVGGALSLSGKSKLIIHKHTQLIFTENHANVIGGAIFFEDSEVKSQCHNIFSLRCFKPESTEPLAICSESFESMIDCFIEFNADIPFNISTSNISILFFFNFAGKSGTAIYGGSLDKCRLHLSTGFQDKTGNKIGEAGVYDENPLQIFLEIFIIDNMTSAISSDPLRICFCNNGIPDCEKSETVSTVRGKQFTLSAVTVGQGNYTVPSLIKADFNDAGSEVQLSILQRVQDTGYNCTDISYRIFTTQDFLTLVLFPDGPCRDTGIARCEVSVSFLPCPDGFVHAGFECVCDKRLDTFNSTCNVDRESIIRVKNNFWIMALYEESSYHGLIIHQAACPFDYCVESAIEVRLNDTNVQCNHNHSGIICGACQDKLSLAFGSLHCLPCSNAYLSLTLLFALAGIVLVAIVLLLQLTVALGTINGLIFYANVVQMNRNIFFPPGATNVLTIFIAWLNLDLGIETCFYYGMDIYAFMWLQFIFPFYIWLLIGFIIFVSRHSTTVTRRLGRNPVSVLATLLFLSYSKILRTIISVLSRTSLQYPDGLYHYVWLYDGNVPYFQRADHIILAVFAVFSLLFLFLPYTLLLLCGHWLQAYSRGWLLSCFNKMIPFLDTYYAPFKKKSRYWPGLLLLVRCILFLSFTFNALGSSSINLLIITSTTVGLTTFAWLQNQLYMKIHNDILEASFILNLCILAAATYHMKETGGSQYKLAYTSVGITFLTFIGILAYHVFLVAHKPGLTLWKRLFHEAIKHRHLDSIFTKDKTTISVPITTIELQDSLLK